MVAFTTATPRLVDSDTDTSVQPDIQADRAVVGRIGPGLASDRRLYPRQQLSLRVAGRRLDHSVDARREPGLNLSLMDVSIGGLKAHSQTRPSLGERVAIFFPPQGTSRGWDAYGRVVRVEPGDHGDSGCTLAVAFDTLPAA